MFSKKNRALLAAGAGAAVLLASGATFALWSDDATIGGAEIHTGNLYIGADDLTWVDNSRDGFNIPGESIDPDYFRLVPGDVIEGSAPLFTSIFDGDNMAVALDVALAGRVVETFYANPEHPFAMGTVTDAVFGDLPLGATPRGLTITPRFDDAADVLSIVFDWRAAPANLGREGTNTRVFSVGDIGLTLRQIRPNHPSAPWN